MTQRAYQARRLSCHALEFMYAAYTARRATLSADHRLLRRGVRMLDHPLKVGAFGQKSWGILAIHPLPQRQDDGEGRAQQKYAGAEGQRA